MAHDRSTEYLRKWFTKAEAEEDVFDRFMSGWLAMSIAASIHGTISGLVSRDETPADSVLVIAYIKSQAHSVEEALEAHRPSMEVLARRKGTKGGTVIDGKQHFCRQFQGKILRTSSCSSEDFAEATAQILNRVRNNLFHGAKVYDDTADRGLLELVTPFLLTFLDASEHLR